MDIEDARVADDDSELSRLLREANQLCRATADALAEDQSIKTLIETIVDPRPELAHRLTPPLLAMAQKLADYLEFEDARLFFGLVHLLLAQVYAETNSLESDPHFQVAWNILRDHPDNPNALVCARQYAKSLLLATTPQAQRKNLPLAFRVLSDAIKLFPQDGELYFHLGFAHLRRNDWAAAEREYLHARQWGYDKPGLELDLASLYQARGDLTRAEDAFRRAAERDRRALHGLSLVLMEQGRFAEALETLDRFVEGLDLSRSPELRDLLHSQRADLLIAIQNTKTRARVARKPRRSRKGKAHDSNR